MPSTAPGQVRCWLSLVVVCRPRHYNGPDDGGWRARMLRPELYLLLLASTIGACSAPDADSELRELMSEAERAAEARNTGFFRDLVATSYKDARGNDRNQIIDLVRGYFFTHSNVEIVSRIEEIELAGSDAAIIVVQTGLVGQQAGRSGIGGLDGQLYRLELELIKTNREWQIIGASWERWLGE